MNEEEEVDTKEEFNNFLLKRNDKKMLLYKNVMLLSLVLLALSFAIFMLDLFGSGQFHEVDDFGRKNNNCA